jgi:TetR/AcrR family transcriptional regulator
LSDERITNTIPCVARARESRQAEAGTTRRRARRDEERLIDSERSRRALVEAAFQEFSANGFAGTTVRAIADRAGLSKDLVSYHFGGKAGLYREVQRQWLDHERTLREPGLPLAELAARYLDDTLSDPRATRLLAWRGLSGHIEEPPDLAPPSDGLASMISRQQSGEIVDDIDPAALALILIGAISAPVLMPQVVRRLFGAEAESDEFRTRYDAGIRALIGHLAPQD